MDKLKKLLKNLQNCTCFSSTHTSDDEDQPKAAKPSSTTSSKASASPPTAQHNPPKTLIIAHGAFQTQYHYQAFLSAVHNETGTVFDRALVPQQSSSGPSPPSDSFDRDVKLLHKTVRGELLDGRDVLLVCHSYGGIPGCEALADLPEKPVDSTPRLGKVLGIVFVSAFVAEAGQSLVTSKMGGRAEWVKIDVRPCLHHQHAIHTHTTNIIIPNRAPSQPSSPPPQPSSLPSPRPPRSPTSTTSSRKPRHLSSRRPNMPRGNTSPAATSAVWTTRR